jgi:hypothetical protein
MSDPRPSSLREMARRAVRLGRRLTTRRQTSPTQQRVVLGVSTVVFLGATVLAWRSLPDIDGRVHWWAFVLVAVLGVPASIWNRGAEFGAIARLTGEHIGIAERVRVAVVGTAANMLPIPGSVVVRGEVLRRRGVALRSIGWATAIAAAVWAGSTALVAGCLLAAMSEHVLLGVVLAVGGAAVCAGSTYSVVSRPSVHDPWRAMAHLVVVEVVSIVLGGLRLWGVLAGLGYSAGIDQAVALTVAGLVSTAVGFAPAGLGVRELAAAAISPLVGLPTSLGLLAAAINRLVELVVLAPASVALVARRPGSPADVPDASGIETEGGGPGAGPGTDTSPPTAVEAAES